MKSIQAKMVPDPDAAEVAQRPAVRWLQRLGVAGFAFFLIKGLLWLAIPALLAYMGSR